MTKALLRLCLVALASLTFACGPSEGSEGTGGGNGGGGDDAQLTCPTISGDTTFKVLVANKDEDEPEADYTFDCVVNVTKAVTIEPGVIIAFKPAGGFTVSGEGSLNAVGTKQEPIVFRSASDEPWVGVSVGSTSADNAFDYVEINNAGNVNAAALNVLSSARLSIKHSSILKSPKLGMQVGEGARLTFAQNTIKNGKQEPLSLPLALLGSLDNKSKLSGNTKARVLVTGRTLEDVTATWPALDVPYFFSGGETRFDGETKVTVEPGAVLRFANGSSLSVMDSSALIADPDEIDESMRVQLLPATDDDFWDGLYIGTSSPQMALNNVEVAWAGNGTSSYNASAITVAKNGRLTLKNSYIHHSKKYGVDVPDTATLSFQKNIFEANEGGPVRIFMPLAKELDALTNYGNPTTDKVRVHDKLDSGTHAWNKLNVPYDIEGDTFGEFVVAGTSKLTLKAGAKVLMGGSSHLLVTDDAVLNIEGSNSASVDFDGRGGATWGGIYIDTPGVTHSFDYLHMKHSSGDNHNQWKGHIFIKNGAASLTNSIIEGGNDCGVGLNGPLGGQPGGSLSSTAGTSFPGGPTNEVCGP